MRTKAPILFAILCGLSLLWMQPSSSVAKMQSNVPLANVCTWEIDDGTRLEAKAEKVNAPDEATIWNVTVRNLATDVILLNREIFYLTSMYIRDLNGDGKPELIIDWDHGVCCSSLEIYEVDAQKAREILNEAYRVDATLIDLSGEGKVDVLISTAEGGAMTKFTTRYVWQGEKYKPMGKVSSEVFIRSIKRQFYVRRR